MELDLNSCVYQKKTGYIERQEERVYAGAALAAS